MSALPVIAIIDVGKTNKKMLLFDEDYNIVYERSARFTETVDEDGDPCENVESLRLSVFDSLRDVFRKKQFDVKAVNFSTYGASFVLVDEAGQPAAPLYNYLKAYPEALKKQFYETYGGQEQLSLQTASPVLGSLNSGLQLYRLKYEKPALFQRVNYALHLPQYLSSLLTRHFYSDITSIGCHTHLWDFEKNTYHRWVVQEGIDKKLAPLAPSSFTVNTAWEGNAFRTGIGLHDSSAALIPYLIQFQQPFLLISTGTWCISLNPFNQSPLTADELRQDCLCYLQYNGKPVKASRLFAGQEHEEQVKRIASYFLQNPVHYRGLAFDAETVARLQNRQAKEGFAPPQQVLQHSVFSARDLTQFASGEEAYHQLMMDIVAQQTLSSGLVLKGSAVDRILVDGGFSKNEVYMNLLAAAFPHLQVYAASMAQGTALGAALAIHQSWNDKPLPAGLVVLKHYPLPFAMPV